MVKVNCAALPATLIESELFGREKGAFTGAIARQAGRFEIADGSTIFLDEIGELPLELQPKLLRVLQEGEFERLGGSRTIKVDVRVIAATNRNLAQAVSEGKFREDLFYRLDVFPIELPPLRERPRGHSASVVDLRQGIQQLDGQADRENCERLDGRLLAYPWPGNIRELRNVIERAMILGARASIACQARPQDAANARRQTNRGHPSKKPNVPTSFGRSSDAAGVFAVPTARLRSLISSPRRLNLA